MNSQKILYWAGLVCLTTILPVSMPAQAEKLSQNSIEITRQESSQGLQRKKSENDKGRDRNHDREYKHRDDHDSDRDHDREYKHRDDRDSDRDYDEDRAEKEHH
jgi:ABC-type Zn2+ transport system substrate-binding protein/surface adhesin